MSYVTPDDYCGFEAYWPSDSIPYMEVTVKMSAMSVAIEIKVANEGWFLLADGVSEHSSLVDGWLELAREIYPGSEIRVVAEAARHQATESTTRH